MHDRQHSGDRTLTIGISQTSLNKEPAIDGRTRDSIVTSIGESPLTLMEEPV